MIFTPNTRGTQRCLIRTAPGAAVRQTLVYGNGRK